MRSFVSGILLCGLAATPAAADSFAEVVAGMALPLAEDDYTDQVDDSPKLGVRFGTAGEKGAGLELGLDFTPVNHELPEVLGFDIDFQRYRILLGGRFGAPVGKGKLRAFGRVGAGVDIVRTSVTQDTLDVDESETDLGLAVEVGGGLLFDAGPVVVGGQVALPFAFHFEDDQNENRIDYEYTGIDLDLLLTVGTSI